MHSSSNSSAFWAFPQKGNLQLHHAVAHNRRNPNSSTADIPPMTVGYADRQSHQSIGNTMGPLPPARSYPPCSWHYPQPQLHRMKKHRVQARMTEKSAMQVITNCANRATA